MNPPVAQYAEPAGHLTFAPALNATSRCEYNFLGADALNKVSRRNRSGSYFRFLAPNGGAFPPVRNGF